MARIIDKHVADGMPAVDYTVKGPMCRLAVRDSRDPRVRRLAASLRGRTEIESVRNAFAYVVKNVPYRSDPSEYEYVQAPIYTLGLVKPRPGYTPHGDCDCQVTALAALMMALGVRCSIRTVAWRVRDMTHVNLRVHLKNGQTIPLDATLKGNPSGGWGEEKPATFDEKVYRCPMMVRSLEDGPGVAAPQQRQLGCSCGGGGNCRCGKGMRRGRRGGCCPQNQATAHSPVNVVVNTGSVTSSRSMDASGRYLDKSNVAPSRSFSMNVPSQGSDAKYVFDAVPIQTEPMMAPASLPETDFSPAVMQSITPSAITPPVSVAPPVPVERLYKEFP